MTKGNERPIYIKHRERGRGEVSIGDIMVAGAACSERLASGVRRVVEWFLSLTWRGWTALALFVLIVVATGVQHYMAYEEALPYQTKAHEAAVTLDNECQQIKKTHNTAYMAMELKCLHANASAKFTPRWKTIQMMVNSSWPHADNIAEWTTAVFAKIIASVQFTGLAMVLVIACWPSVQRRLGFIPEKYNRARGNKVESELHKIAAAQAIAGFLTATLNKTPQAGQKKISSQTGIDGEAAQL